MDTLCIYKHISKIKKISMNNYTKVYIYHNNEHNIANQRVQSIVGESFRRHFNKRLYLEQKE